MKRYLAILAVVAIVMSPVISFAEEAAAAAKDLTLKGKITKAENKSAEGKVTVVYTLTMADGKVVLPAPAAAKEGATAVNLDEFVGKDVEVVAKGTEATKGDKKVIKVTEVVSVKAVEAKPAAK